METTNELAIGETSAIKDLTQEAGGIIAIGDVEKTEAILRDLASKHGDMEVTEKNVKVARKALAALRAPRYDLDKIIKHNSKAYNELKKLDKEKLEQLRFIVNEPEEKLLVSIKAVEEEIQKKKDEQKRLEEEERNRINDSILAWSEKLAQIYENSVSIRSVAPMAKAQDELNTEMGDGVFAEFLHKAEELYYKYEGKMPGLQERIDKAKAQDDEAKRLEEEKEKLAADKLENYTVLMETIEALGGEPSEFLRDEQNPPTDEDFLLVRNEIKRLKNPPEEVEQPIQEEPNESVVNKPNDQFDSEETVPPSGTDGSIAEPQSFRVYYSRNELIAICEKAFVPQKHWKDRDSASSHIKLGSCYALLKAGCKFEIQTKENTREGSGCTTDDQTIWVQFWVHDFNWFEFGGEGEGNANHDYHFYLPTPQRLQEREGKDWY